jgi:hypothetical protein
MRTLLKIIAMTFAGTLALSLLLYYAVFFVNLHDRKPSALSARMAQQYEARPAVPEADNGYVYAMGFAASWYREPPMPSSQRFARPVCSMPPPSASINFSMATTFTSGGLLRTASCCSSTAS